MAFSKRAPRAGAFSKVAADVAPAEESNPAPAYSSRPSEEPYPSPSGRRPEPARPAASYGGDDDDEWWRSSAKKKEEQERRERMAEVAARNKDQVAKSQAQKAEEAMRKRREKQKATGETAPGAAAASSRPAPVPGAGYGGPSQFASSDLEARLGVGLPGRAGQSRGLGGGFSGMQARGPAGRGRPGLGGQTLGAGASVSRAEGGYGGFLGFGARGQTPQQQRKEMLGQTICVREYNLKPELNGLYGTLESFEELGQQWHVKLADGQVVKLRDNQIAIVKFGDNPDGSGEEPLPTNLECIGGHYLVQDEAEGEYECSCDMCNADVAPKEKFLYCERCDWGLCRMCASKEMSSRQNISHAHGLQEAQKMSSRQSGRRGPAID